MSAREPAAPLSWPNEIDEIFAGDLVVAVGSPTAKGGAVLNSVTPLGLHDRAAGTVSFTTSLGFGRKLDRIANDPRIAVAYHTRQHGYSDRAAYVLVQGIASIRTDYTEAQRAHVRRQASLHLGELVSGRFWDWWLKAYYEDRVAVEVHARRILWWPTHSLREDPIVLGDPLPETSVPSQQAPPDAMTPRVSVPKVARAATMDHRLVGFLQADGMPLILPVTVASATDTGLMFLCDSDMMPAGGRRAAFLAHRFCPKLVGLSAATHTGWLQVDRTASWTPHSRHAFRAPPSKMLLLLANGAVARWRYRQAKTRASR